jgi:VanZ family protein
MCLASFRSLPKIGINHPDKLVHITFHFVFTILWSCYLKEKRPNAQSFFIKVLMASIVFGSVIEIAQGLFTTTRHADILDVFANTLGSVTAIIVMFVVVKFSSKDI